MKGKVPPQKVGRVPVERGGGIIFKQKGNSQNVVKKKRTSLWGGEKAPKNGLKGGRPAQKQSARGKSGRKSHRKNYPRYSRTNESRRIFPRGLLGEAPWVVQEREKQRGKPFLPRKERKSPKEGSERENLCGPGLGGLSAPKKVKKSHQSD